MSTIFREKFFSSTVSVDPLDLEYPCGSTGLLLVPFESSHAINFGVMETQFLLARAVAVTEITSLKVLVSSYYINRLFATKSQYIFFWRG